MEKDKFEIGDIFIVQFNPNNVLIFSNSRKVITVRYDSITIGVNTFSFIKDKIYTFKQFSANSWILDCINIKE